MGGVGTGGGYHLIVFVYFLCFCILFSHVLNPIHYLGDESLMAFVLSLCFFFICFVSGPFN